MAAAQDNMICAVCTEVYRSPRFLPCYHSFCLECLEQLARRHGNVIPCPICRAPATVPPGGVRDLQVNFYFTEEALERARSEAPPSTCPFHPKESAIFHCMQCDEAICIRCKLTKHEGHVTEDLSEAAARCRKTIENEQIRLEDCVKRLITKSKASIENEKWAREKRKSVEAQVEARYDVIVAMAAKYRDSALKELQEISDNLEKDLAAENQRVQHGLDSVLQIQDRASQALSRASDTEVMQVEKDMIRGPGSAERLRELEAGLPDTTYRPGLHGDFTNDVEENIKRYIGSPVKLEFPCLEKMEVVCVGRCGEGECSEVHALQESEDKSLRVVYGGPGGDFSKETEVSFIPNGSEVKRNMLLGVRVSYVTRKCSVWKWTSQENRNIGSKGDKMFSILQNCANGTCFIMRMIKSEKQNSTHAASTVLIQPKVHMIHNFDSNETGHLFAVIDEAKKSSDELRNNDHEEKVQNSRRVVRLYRPTSNSPVATYTPPKQPFFPADVCFFRDNLLLIADWVNDSVHVVKIIENQMAFINYLPGSGDIVRPTALNFDMSGQLLMGCGDGRVLKFPGSGLYIPAMTPTLPLTTFKRSRSPVSQVIMSVLVKKPR